MTLNRRSFLSVLAGAACSVLGAVYGVPSDQGGDDFWAGGVFGKGMEKYPRWKSAVKDGPHLSMKQLEVVVERQCKLMGRTFDWMFDPYCPPGVMYGVLKQK